MCYERRRAEACVDESAHHARGATVGVDGFFFNARYWVVSPGIHSGFFQHGHHTHVPARGAGRASVAPALRQRCTGTGASRQGMARIIASDRVHPRLRRPRLQEMARVLWLSILHVGRAGGAGGHALPVREWG
jgi:hypothetical protein